VLDAAALHAALPLTLDTHVDIPWPAETFQGPRRADPALMRAGGVGGACFAAYVPQGPRTVEGFAEASGRALAMLDAIRAIGEDEGNQLATTAAELHGARAARRTAVVPCVENGHALGEDLGLLAEFRRAGARYLTLCHNGHNLLCDSSNPRADLGDGPALHGGLSDFGREVIAEMNRLGMLVDISHASQQTALQAAQASRTPVLATHSCVRALCDVPRNVDDLMLDALRDTGGMVNITGIAGFLKRGAKPDGATVGDYVDHIEYVIGRCGLAHVGISSDFDGGGCFTGWMDESDSLNLTAELVRRGYGEHEIAQIWGGNFLRLLARAEEDADA
jgi:membrane dipeptidase